MIERFISQVRTAGPFAEMEADEAKRLRANFPPLVSRRFSILPLLIGEVTKGVSFEPEDEVFFLSQFSGSVGLEKYLDSFPAPSPLHFQNSVHGGPLELVLVSRKQPVRNIVPFSGREEILLQAFRAAAISPAPAVHVVGGEERGDWTARNHLGSDSSFAFYFCLRRERGEAEATLTWNRQANDGQTLPLDEFTRRLAGRKDARCSQPETGGFSLRWL